MPEKINKAASELLREATSTVDEELETKESGGGGGGGGGGFEDYPEQPVLSPSVEETLPARNRAERGKRRVEE